MCPYTSHEDIRGGVELHLHSFLTPPLEVSEWPASRPNRFTPKEPSGTHGIGSWDGFRAGLVVL